MFVLRDDFLGNSCVNSAKKLQLLFLNSEIWRLYQLRLAETASPSQNYVNSKSVLSKIQQFLGGPIPLQKKTAGVRVKTGWKEDAIFLLIWTLRVFGDLFWIAKIEHTTLFAKFSWWNEVAKTQRWQYPATTSCSVPGPTARLKFAAAGKFRWSAHVSTVCITSRHIQKNVYINIIYISGQIVV